MNHSYQIKSGYLIKIIEVHAPIYSVWQNITEPILMKQWMPAQGIEIVPGQAAGSRFETYGHHNGIRYNTKGTIFLYAQPTLFEYSYWNSLLQQADIHENYSIVRFTLRDRGIATELTFKQTRFVSEAEYEYAHYYWTTALFMIKKLSEKNLYQKPRLVEPNI